MEQRGAAQIREKYEDCIRRKSSKNKRKVGERDIWIFLNMGINVFANWPATDWTDWNVKTSSWRRNEK